MRGEIIYKILKALENGLIDQIDFASAFLKAGYGVTSGKMEYEYSKIKSKRLRLQLMQQKINNFKKYLSKLKNEGIILENNSKQIYLSNKGKKKLSNFKNSPLSNKKDYKKEVGGKVIVVSYDIPVAFNRERNILRDILRMLGFNLIHKSVWIGKVKLPERFIADLQRLGILEYVEILEVTKSGTLESKS